MTAWHVFEHDIGGGAGGGSGGMGGEVGGGPVHGSTEYDLEWISVWKVPPVAEMVTGRTCGYG